MGKKMDMWVKEKKLGGPFRTTLIYVFAGGIWILFSDSLLNTLIADPKQLTEFQTLKGWFFVAVTGGLLYIFMNNDLKSLTASRDQLAASVEYYLRLFDRFPNPIWRAGVDSLCNYFNKAWLDFTGRSIEEELGNGWADGIHPDDLSNCINNYLTAFEQKEAFQINYRLRNKDGEYRWVADFGIPIYDLKNKFTGYIGSCYDTTELINAQEELKVSEQKFRVIFNSLSEAVTLSDLKGKIIDCNDTALKMYGFNSKEEIIGINSLELVAEKDRENASNMFDDLVSRRLLKDIELTFLTKEGREFHAEASASLVNDSSGYPVAIVGVSRDISERKKLEKEFREINLRNQILASSLDNSPLGVMLWGIKDNEPEILDWNKSSERIFGWKKEEVLGTNYLGKILPDHERVKVKNVIEILTEGNIPVNMQFECLNNEREKIIVDWFNTPVKDPVSGEIKVLSLANDVTEQKNVELLIKQSEERLRTLVEQASDGIFVSDPNGNYVDVNEAACRMVGYSKDELKNMNVRDFIPEEDLEKEPIRYDDLKSGKVVVNERRLIKKDGTLLPVEISAKILTDGSLQGIVRDITDRIRSENILRESKERYRLLFKNNPHPMWVYDLESLAFLAVNDAAVVHYGYSVDEFLSMTIKDIRPPDDIGRLMENISHVMEGIDEAGIWRHRKKDGSIIFVEITSHAMKFGSRKAEVILAIDVTERIKAQAENKKLLEEKNELLEQLQLQRDRMPVGYIVTDENLHFKFLNPAAEAIFGYKKEELIGTNPFENIIPPSAKEYVQNVHLNLLNGKMEVPRINENLTKDGRRIICEWLNTPIKDKEGKVVEILSMVQDITERIRSEEREMEMGHIIENSVNEIYIFDAENLLFQQVNKGAKDNLGYTLEELQQMTPLDIKPEFTKESFIKILQPLKDEEKDRINFTTFHRRKNGTTYPVEVHIEKTISGGQPAFMAVILDISERIKAERALKESELKYRKLFEEAPISLWEEDFSPLVNELESLKRKGIEDIGTYLKSDKEELLRLISFVKITNVNSLTLSLYKAASKEMLLGNLMRLGTEDTLKAHIDSIAAVFENKNKFQREVINLNLEGEKLILDMKWSVMPGHEKDYSRVLVSFNDITERILYEERIQKLNEELEERVKKRTEQLVEANKELEAFSYSVSHDLRAPLRAISGFSKILLDDFSDILGREGERVLNIIDANVHKMGLLIDDLLKFSHMSRQELKFGEIDMNQLVKSVCEELISPAEKKKIKLILNELPIVLGDQSMIKVVWTNLISNAVKFSYKNKTPIIEIGGSENPDTISYYIKDNGVGFDMKYAHKLFAVFQRLHSEEEFEGTGVGLAIVQRIISKHNGKIWAEAEVNNGAIFTFMLPKSQYLN